jgi:LysM repeat protein
MRYVITALLCVNMMAMSVQGANPPGADLRDSLIHYAKTLINTPYRSGSKGPNGFDCSGFTSYVYGKFGKHLNASSGSQVADGNEIDMDQLQKGDLVFFKGRSSKRSRIGHVGMFIGNDGQGGFNFIHSANGGGVRIDNSRDPYYAKRLLTACNVLKDVSSHSPSVDVKAAPPSVNDMQIAANKVHKVKKGESLYTIAKEYNVTEQQLREWNSISSNKLKAGQSITIKTEPATAAKTQKQETPDTGNKKAVYYTVRKGDSFYTIAKKHHIGTDKLLSMNNTSGGKVKPGDKVIVGYAGSNKSVVEQETTAVESTSGKTHTVRKGETLSGIAEKYGLTTAALKRLNPELKKGKLKPGRTIVVGNGDTASTTAKPERIQTEETSPETTETDNQPALKTRAVVSKQTHKIQKGETLSEIAEKYGVSSGQIKRLNPGLKESRLQPGKSIVVKQVTKEIAIKLPAAENKPKAEKTVVAKENTPVAAGSGKEIPRQWHKIRKGETTSSVARKYNVSEADLKRWNGLRGTKLKTGARIIVKMGEEPQISKAEPEQQVKQAPEVITKPVTEEKHVTDEANPLQTGTPAVASTIPAESTHVVEQGETLYSIAKKYHALPTQLQQWNNLTGDEVQTGMTLNVKKPKVAGASETTANPTVTETTENQSVKLDTLTTSYVVSAPHEVQPGETLQSIAEKYNITVAQLKQWNHISNKHNSVTPGQKLMVEVTKTEYVVVTPKTKKTKTAGQAGTKADDKAALTPKRTAVNGKYTVKKGESLYVIAKDFNLTTTQLKEYNRLATDDVKEGQVLLLSPDTAKVKQNQVTAKADSSMLTYVVKPGDTMFSVAKAHHVTVEELKENNDIQGNDLNIGQHLAIPKR